MASLSFHEGDTVKFKHGTLVGKIIEVDPNLDCRDPACACYQAIVKWERIPEPVIACFLEIEKVNP